MIFTGSRTAVVRFVSDILKHLKGGSPSTTITLQVKLEGCCVSIVTDMLSDDIVLELAKNYSLTLILISPLPTQGGQFLAEFVRKDVRKEND